MRARIYQEAMERSPRSHCSLEGMSHELPSNQGTRGSVPSSIAFAMARLRGIDVALQLELVRASTDVRLCVILLGTADVPFLGRRGTLLCL
jgi:hypothetical protein